jgi:transposase
LQLNPVVHTLLLTPFRRTAMPPASKVVVRLTDDQRDALDRLVRTGTHPAAMRRRAAILLRADADGPDAWTDEAIAEHLETTRITVQRVRQQFSAEGLDATLHRKKPTGRQYRKLDGQQEARLVALACSKAPDGHARWTMKLLADKLVELEVVESIDPATVWRTLQKTTSSRGSSSSGSSPRTRAGRSWRRWRT